MRRVASLAIVLAVALGVALVAPGPATAKTKYRYDCNGRSGTYVAAVSGRCSRWDIGLLQGGAGVRCSGALRVGHQPYPRP